MHTAKLNMGGGGGGGGECDYLVVMTLPAIWTIRCYICVWLSDLDQVITFSDFCNF